jgi:hypothetical protein
MSTERLKPMNSGKVDGSKLHQHAKALRNAPRKPPGPVVENTKKLIARRDP